MFGFERSLLLLVLQRDVVQGGARYPVGLGRPDVVLIFERNQINRPSGPLRRRRFRVITHVGS